MIVSPVAQIELTVITTCLVSETIEKMLVMENILLLLLLLERQRCRHLLDNSLLFLQLQLDK